MDQLAARLRATFVAELEEQVGVMNTDLLALERAPEDAQRLKSLFRVAHTLKGAARAADIPLVEKACHSLESLLARVRNGKESLNAETIATLYAAADALADARRRLARDGSLAGSPLEQLVGSGAEPTPLVERPAPRPTLSAAASKRVEPVSPAPASPAPATSDERIDRGSQIRIEAAAIDRMLAAATTLRLARARAVTRTRELLSVSDRAATLLSRWKSAIPMLRQHAASVDGAMGLDVLDELDDALRALVANSTHASSTLALEMRTLHHAVEDVSDGVVRMRMRPFADICEALPRMVRDLARTEGKDVRLEIEGGDVEADRNVLDTLREAIVHLVRNAISHGAEEPTRRVAAGKPAKATVTVAASLQGGGLAVRVSDDGAGIDTRALRAAWTAAGRSVPEGDAAVAQAIFEGGVSTRAETTIVSGRGVGLDLVRAAVEAINGSVRAEWRAGQGASFTLECPLSLASIRVVLVQLGPYTLGIPSAAVERLHRVPPDAIARAEGRDVLLAADGPIPIVSLARVLGSPYVERPLSGMTPVVQLSAGGRRLCFAVDGFGEECDVTIRPINARRPLPLLTGAAVGTTGVASPILNAAVVVSEALRVAGNTAESLVSRPASLAPKRRILVVDDSITTRTLEASVLEAAGYDVVPTVDGADAWRALQEEPIDLVVSDVEMPRMDGFTLCETIRASDRFGRLPVVLVTALETTEQRARGLQAGADAYIGKSSFDQQTLLDVVRQYLE